MKLFIVLFVMVAVSYAVPTLKYNKDLVKDIQEYEKKCFNITQASADISDAVENNDGVKKAIAFIKTDDFKEIVEGLDAEKSYLDVLSDLEDQGFPAYEVVNEMLKAFNITPIPIPPLSIAAVNDDTLDDLLDKLQKDIDFDCVENVYKNLFKTKLEYKAFDTHVHRQEFKELMKKFRESEGLKKANESFLKNGLNMPGIANLLMKLFHFDF